MDREVRVKTAWWRYTATRAVNYANAMMVYECVSDPDTSDDELGTTNALSTL